MDVIVPLGSVALMIVGAHRAAAGAVTVGDVVSAIYLLTLLAVPIRGIGWVLGQMPQALVAFRRVGAIAEAATEVDEPGHLAMPRAGAGAPRLRGRRTSAPTTVTASSRCSSATSPSPSSREPSPRSSERRGRARAPSRWLPCGSRVRVRGA